MTSAPKPGASPPATTAGAARPKYYDLNLAHLPLPGLVSIVHRVSGALLFFPVIPAVLYLMQASLGSEEGWQRWARFFADPVVKLAAIGCVWLYAHHFFAGIRYLLLDVHVGVHKGAARRSAGAVFVLGLATAALVGWRLW